MLQERVVAVLRWSEKYTKTDMLYLASGGFWLTLELVIAAFFSLALAVVFGHFASKDLYGNYKYVLSIAALISGFSLSGIGTAITQATARGKEGALRQGFLLNLRWSAPMVVLALCIAAYYFLQGNNFLALSLCVVAALSPLLYSFSLFDNFLIGRREFSRSAAYSVLGNVASTAVLVAALFFGERAIILVIAYFAVNIATSTFFYIRTARRAHNSETDPGMLNYGFHLSLMSVVGAIADKIDSIIVFTLLGPAQLAVYTYAIAMPEQIKGIVKNVTPLSMPKFAHRPINEIRQNIWGRIAQLTLGLTVVIALYIVLAPWLFRILFPVYTASIGYSQLYALSLLVTGVPPVLLGIFQAHKKTKALYVSSNVSSLILIIILPPFVYFWGITGAIASQIVYRCLSVGITILEFMLLKD